MPFKIKLCQSKVKYIITIKSYINSKTIILYNCDRLLLAVPELGSPWRDDKVCTLQCFYFQLAAGVYIQATRALRLSLREQLARCNRGQPLQGTARQLACHHLPYSNCVSDGIVSATTVWWWSLC